MSCDHELDAEFLYPSDAAVLDLYEANDDVLVQFAVPCPECDQSLELTARVESVEEAALSLPLDDAEDVYD
jgi:hypothetical protein